jgi:hypothetical protein
VFQLFITARYARVAEDAEFIFFFWFAPEIEGKPKTTCPPGRFVAIKSYTTLDKLTLRCLKQIEAKLQVVFICRRLSGK